MKSQKATQTMKPATAAKKLGIHLLAAPAEFQEGVVSRDELNALQADPPQWLRDLRADGPHPRSVAASRLGVSIAGLARGEVTEALTTEQIDALKAEEPEWLQRERTIQAEVRREAARVNEKHRQEAEQDAAKSGKTDGPASRGKANGATASGARTSGNASGAKASGSMASRRSPKVRAVTGRTAAARDRGRGR